MNFCWTRFTDPLKPFEIQKAEFILNTLYKPLGIAETLKRPILTSIFINDRQATAILWHSDVDGRMHYFPVSHPTCPEFEFTNPLEWDTIFIGTLAQLRESETAKLFKFLPAGDADYISILVVKKDLIGFRQQFMRNELFRCTMMVPCHDGRVCYPRTHYHQP